VRSIRATLLLTTLAGLFLFFAVAASVFYFSVRRSLVREFDRSLTAKTLEFSDMCEMEESGGNEKYDVEFDEFNLPEFQPSPNAAYYQLWTEEGRIIARSRSLEGSDLAREPVPTDEPRVGDVTLPDGRRGRACSYRFSPVVKDDEDRPVEGSPGKRLVLVVARPRGNLDSALGALLTGTALLSLILPVGAAFVVRWGVGRGLMPLDRVALRTGELTAEDLDYRFPVEDLPEELRPVCLRLNELLERLEKTFERERRFSADAAHELRTPIAELRSLSEVGLGWNPSKLPEDDPREYFTDALEIAKQMERRMTDLLALARSRSGRQPVSVEGVDISALARSVWEEFRSEAERKGISWTLEAPDRLQVKTDRSLLESVLRNLFSNAAAYTPPNATVRSAVAQMGGGYRVEIANTTDDLEPDDVPHLAEPFWRKDEARTEEGHAGLGLSLAAAYASLLGMHFEVVMPERGWLRVRLDWDQE